MLLWAIGGVFTIILIHGLVGYAQYRIWLQPISYSIGIPTFAKLIAPNKIIKKNVFVFWCNLCSLYYSAYMCLHAVHLT